MRSSIAVAVCLAVACGGGSGAADYGALPAEIRADPAVELAARLPRGAHRCAVARPGKLSALQRAVYVALSQGESLAFLPDAPFVATASAYVEVRGGRFERLTLIRTSADRETVRRYLDERSGLLLTWPDEDERRGPRYGARFLDEHTLSIGNPDFPESRRVGAEARCLTLASRFPEALEVAARRGSLGLLAEIGGQIPRRVDYRASVEESRLTLVRTYTMQREAEDARLPFFDGPMFGELPLSIIAESRDQNVEGRRIIETTRVAFEDLMLAAEDERRIDGAIAEDRRRQGPQRADAIDVSNLALVHEQRLLWQDLVDAAGPRGAEARVQLGRLLERAIESHPREAELRAHLFDLLARHVGNATQAAEVAAQAIADGVGDAATFAQLRREAFARSDSARLAQALREDAVVSRADADDAAEALATAVGDGADYAFAEGAFVAGRALMRRARGARARRVAPVALDLAGLVQSLGVLSETADVAGALWVAIEGARPPWGIPRFSAEDAPRIALDVGRDVLIGAASTDGDERLGALARALAGSLSPGPIVVSFLVVPFGGTVARPAAWGRFEGELADDQLTIERIAGPAAVVDWQRVDRYLVAPLASSTQQIFPAPELAIVGASSRDVDALMALSDLHPFVICRRRELNVSCQSAPEQRGALADFVIEFAGEVLEPAAATLVGRRRR